MPLLRDLLSKLTREEIAAICEKARPALRADHEAGGPVRRPAPEAPGAMIDVTLPDGRTTPVPALPLEMKGRRFGRRLTCPAPASTAPRSPRLGYAPDDIERLAGAGILGLDRAAAPPAQPVAGTRRKTPRRHSGGIPAEQDEHRFQKTASTDGTGKACRAQKSTRSKIQGKEQP